MALDANGGLTGTGQQLLKGEGDMLLSFTTELAPNRLEKLSCSQAVISHRYDPNHYFFISGDAIGIALLYESTVDSMKTFQSAGILQEVRSQFVPQCPFSGIYPKPVGYGRIKCSHNLSFFRILLIHPTQIRRF